MKKVIRLTENDLHRIVKESVKRVVMEGSFDDFDGYDNDLDYDTVYEEACHFIRTNNPGVMSWRGIAQAIGFKLNTIGPNDMETLKDAIQDAMCEEDI